MKKITLAQLQEISREAAKVSDPETFNQLFAIVDNMVRFPSEKNIAEQRSISW